MAGIGKQLRGSGIAKIQNQRTSFKDGSDDPFDKKYQGDRFRPIPIEPEGMGGAEDTGPDTSDVYKHMKRHKKASGGRAGYVQGGGAKVGDVKIKIPPYLRKGMVKMGLKKGGSANWIQGAIKKPGALRKSLGVKAGEKIPASKLEAAAKKPGKLGRRARFAQTLRGLKK